MKVDFFRHSLGPIEAASLASALEGLFLTAGPLTQRFEADFAAYTGCPRVVGTSSCTAALFLCLKALGVGPGDQVITSPMTFMATSNAILETGANPVFVDVEPSTGNLDPGLAALALTDRTKAVLPVHLYGQMCDMPALSRLAQTRGLHLIEDAAHCVEGSRNGIRPGQLGDAACYSFYATKNLTAGEGGAVATRHAQLADRLLLLRSHGMNREAARRYVETFRHWDMLTMGYKANMYDLQAALLLPQLPAIEARLARREALARRYTESLGAVEGIDLPVLANGTTHARHLFTIWVDPAIRDTLLERLQAEGVGVAVNYRPVHLLTYYRERFGYRPGMFPQAERIGARTLSLPLYPSLGDAQIDYVIRTVRRLVEELMRPRA